jgi:hypothetical protein
MTPLRPGRYRHYKGNEYSVLSIARHSETLEELVVYRQEYGDRGLWVRPVAMFCELVEVNGRQVPRFEYLGDLQVDSCDMSARCQADINVPAGNLLTDLPSKSPLAPLPAELSSVEQLPEELVQILVQRPNVRIERIVSIGQASPEGFWYDQNQVEFVVLLQGSAQLCFEGQRLSR